MAGSGSPTKERVWQFLLDDDFNGDVEAMREAVAARMVELETIGHAAGGAFQAIPARRRLRGDEFETVGWLIAWNPSAPTVAPAPEAVEPEAVPLEAEAS